MESLYLKRFSDLVNKSNLSKEDKKALIDIFSKATDEDIENALSLCMRDSYWLLIINDNFKAKKEALSSGDADLWKKILKGEQTQFQTVQ